MEKKTLTQSVYDDLYASIVNAEITCNDILTEARLAEQLHVSKAPVREALLMLCQENILQSVPRTGYLVTRISPAQLAKMVEARLLLEPHMLEIGWTNIGPEQVHEMHELHEKYHTEQNLKGPILERWKANIDFHLTLASYCKNDYLIDALHRILRASARAATQCFLGYRESGHEASYHEEVLAALDLPDFERARKALISDIREIM